MTNPFHRSPPLFVRLTLGWCVALACGTAMAAVDARFWPITPYEIRVQVAVDSRSVPSGVLADRVADHLVQRADAAIGPLWNLEVETLAAGDRLEALRGTSDGRLLERAAGYNDDLDKLIVVTLRETALGIELTGVECNPLLEHVGRRRTPPPCEPHAAAEAAFGLLLEVFSPVAVFTVDRDSGQDASLSFRGSQLPQRPGAPVAAPPGTVLLPVLRRTDREGRVVENGVLAAPWTYFLLSDESGDHQRRQAKIYSHTKRPFGVRRRGRVEQYALVLHEHDRPTQIHLHARGDASTPLSGYEVFMQDGDAAQRTAIGATSAQGLVTLRRGDSPLPIVFIRSGSTVVAKAPIPVGAVDRVTIPLLDERPRLEAEAKLSLLREELIDLVARRNILAARIRDQAKKREKVEARRLLEELNAMPGRAQFNQRLRRLQQQAKSDDVQVQQRIDRLFADTAVVLGAFLGADQVETLRREIDAAPDAE